jgi:hypothetical protein
MNLNLSHSSLDVRDFIHDDGSGTNNVISTMAFIPKFKTSGWPQAALNDLEVGGFWIDVYEASQPDATSLSRGGTVADTPAAVAACSKPGVVPWTDIGWQNARIAASNRSIGGRSCHLVTPFERFAVLSLIMAAGQWGQHRRGGTMAYLVEEYIIWSGIFMNGKISDSKRVYSSQRHILQGLSHKMIHILITTIMQAVMAPIFAN